MAIESIPKLKQENNENSKVSSDIKKLWNKYNIPFNPPKPGGLAEEKLINKCEEYTKLSIKGESGSEGNRRALHNEISSMLLGKERSQLDNITAEMIADFACELSYGLPLREAIMEFNEYQGKEG